MSALAPLGASLPSLPGTLPDLFRRGEATTARDEPSPAAQLTSGEPRNDEPRTRGSNSDEITRAISRRAALGPLTYGRRMVAADAPASGPIGMRGVHLDVRG
jgi:hypothetical protein